MSLYDSASLAMIPSGIKDGKLYSAKPINGAGDFTFTRGANLAATRVDENGLIEKGRENLLLHSNQFDTTWTNVSSSETGGQAGYDGSTDAWKLDISSTPAFIAQSISLSNLQTLSFYAKAGTLNFCRIYSATGPNSYADFDLVNGTVGTTNLCIDTNIESIGNGWYRCSITFSANTSAIRIYPIQADNDLTATSGNIYIQDAQLEEGSQATGYIETTTAPVREGAGQGYKVDDKLSITTNEGHDIEFRLVEGSNATTVTVGMEATKPSKPVPFPVTKMRVADSTDRRVLIMDQRSRYVFPKPTPYLLDSYEGAAAAYSLRRLRSAYTGPAVRVRRESNNDELDIYFDGQGNLDTASLEAFCAGTNGFVKVWYDQGPGGNNTEQTTTANQPQIVASGSIIPEGGKPAIEFDGSDDVISVLGITAFTNYYFASVQTVLALKSGFGIVGSFSSGSGNGWGIRETSKLYNYDANSLVVSSTGAISTNEQFLLSSNCASTQDIYKNATQLVSVTGSLISHDDIVLGSNGSSGFYNITMQEFVLYTSDQSSNRAGIETNINDYYNIY